MLDWLHSRVCARSREEEGVTLVEVIIVMVLIAILFTIGAGTWRNYVNAAYDRQAKANLEEAHSAAEELFQQDRRFDATSSTVATQLGSLRPERRFKVMPANPASVDADADRKQGPQQKPAIYVRSAPSQGDEPDTGQITLCTQSRSGLVFCLRSSEETGLRLEPNGAERTGIVRTRAKSFAMAMRIADGNEESEPSDDPDACGTGAKQDCLINTERTGWTSGDRGVASSANGAPTVKLACDTQSSRLCPEDETGEDFAQFTWIVSGGWRAPWAATHNPPGVRCYLDLKNVTEEAGCATDDEALLTRDMLSAKNDGKDPFGSHTFVVRVANDEGTSETSYTWTILPGIPKVAITPLTLAADDIDEKCYQSLTDNGIAQWRDKTSENCAGADVTTYRGEKSTSEYSRPTDNFVPAYPNRYEAVQYRRASFRWHADLEPDTADDRIEKVYCLIERPVPGYAPGDPNYDPSVGLTGDLTATQDDDWQLVTPSVANPDANYDCPGAQQFNSGRNWTGTISAETFAGLPLPFHNDIPYRITVIATNQSGASVRQRFIWFIADRTQNDGSNGAEVCFSPITGLAQNGASRLTPEFTVTQDSDNPVSGIHRVVWPKVDDNWIGPQGSPVNGRVDRFFPGPQYPPSVSVTSNQSVSNLYRLGKWAAGTGPAHNDKRFFFPVIENGTPPYIPAAPAATMASGPADDSYLTDAFYQAHKDHINAGYFSMQADRQPPARPTVAVVGGGVDTAPSAAPASDSGRVGTYYNRNSVTLQVTSAGASGDGCAVPAVEFEYREFGSLDNAGDLTGGWTAWQSLPSSGQITVSREGVTMVQVRGRDAVGNTNGQAGSTAEETVEPTTYYVRLDRTAPTAPGIHYNSDDPGANYTLASGYPYYTFASEIQAPGAFGGAGVDPGNWTLAPIRISAIQNSNDVHSFASGVDYYARNVSGDAVAGNPSNNTAVLFLSGAGDQGTTSANFYAVDKVGNVGANSSSLTGRYDIVDPPTAGSPFVDEIASGGEAGEGAAGQFLSGLNAGELSAYANKIEWRAAQADDNLSGIYRSEMSTCRWDNQPPSKRTPYVNGVPQAQIVNNTDAWDASWSFCDPDGSANLTNGSYSNALNRIEFSHTGLTGDEVYSSQLRSRDKAGNAAQWSPIGTGVTHPPLSGGTAVAICKFNVWPQCGVTTSKPSTWPSGYDSGTYTTDGSAAAEAGHPWGGALEDHDGDPDTPQIRVNHATATLGTIGFNGSQSARLHFEDKGDAVAFDFGSRSGDCNFVFRAKSDDAGTYLMGFIGASDNNMEQFPNPSKTLGGFTASTWTRIDLHPDRAAGPGAGTHLVIQRWSDSPGTLWLDNLYLLDC
jgi:Tfp pilus assembly protein PilE